MILKVVHLPKFSEKSMNLSKKQRQIIQKLQQKKYRQQLGLFVVEGKKNIAEFLNSDLELEQIFCTENYWNVPKNKTQIIDYQELKSISFLKNPEQGIAIFKLPNSAKILPNKGLIVALDNIQDPGNLGTIIRLCDWFHIKQIVCNLHSVDCFNPKVVQATMGSLTRVSVFYTDLKKYLSEAEIPIFGSVLSGENVYQTSLPQQAILVMGNEANGISPEILSLCNRKITIPQFGENQTESLNVAMASAILLSEFRRNFS